jgi:hypothetical protein
MGFQPDPSTKSVSTYSNPIAVSDSDIHNSPLKALTAQDTADYQAQLQKIDMPKYEAPPAVGNFTNKEVPAPNHRTSNATNPRKEDLHLTGN